MGNFFAAGAFHAPAWLPLLPSERQARAEIARSHRSGKTKSSPRFRRVRGRGPSTFSRARNYVKQYERRREGREGERNASRYRYIEKFQRPFPRLRSFSSSPPPWSSFHEQLPRLLHLSPSLPSPPAPRTSPPCFPINPRPLPLLRQRLMRGMQFPQAPARLSSGAPFPLRPDDLSPVPTCTFVLIPSRAVGRQAKEKNERGGILRATFAGSRQCLRDPVNFAARFESPRDETPPACRRVLDRGTGKCRECMLGGGPTER